MLNNFSEGLLDAFQHLGLIGLSFLREGSFVFGDVGVRCELIHFGQRNGLLGLGVEDILDQSEQEDNSQQDQQFGESVLQRSVLGSTLGTAYVFWCDF